MSIRGCPQTISQSDSKALFDEISLSPEATICQWLIGADGPSGISRKGPEDDGLRVCGQSLNGEIAVNVTNQSVFCPPRLGKPNPLEPKPLKGPDTRSRVIQKGSKETSIWYAAFNLLRERYKAPNTQNLQERQFEKLASSRRKAITQHEDTLPDITYQLHNELAQKHFKAIDKKAAIKPSTKAFLEYIDTKCKIKASPLLSKFVTQNQCDNLYEYLFLLKHSSRAIINNFFFDQINVETNLFFETIQAKDPEAYSEYCQGENWETLPLTKKDAVLDHLAKFVCAERFNLKTSSWHPKDPIDRLIAELKSHGPLAISGRFGPTQYSVPPLKLGEKIQGRDVFGWSKSAKKNDTHKMGGTILVVGAEKTEDGAYVYFINPMDESDPQHPEKQIVYKMTYGKLVSPDHIADLFGILRDDAPESVGYAVCRAQPS